MEDLQTLIRRFGFALWRKRWVAIAVAWALCIGGWFGVAAIPNQYEANARIYVDADAVLTPLLRGIALDNTQMSQLDVLQHTALSRPNLEKLISKTDLELQIAAPTDLERMVLELSEGIRISPQTKNLFSISYRNKSPKLAYDVVQQFLTIFIESKAGTNRSDMENARQFLEQQITQYEQKLRLAETKRAEFRAKYLDVLPSDATGVSRLEAARTNIAQLEEHLKDATQRNGMLKQQLDTTPEMLTSEQEPGSAVTTGGGTPGGGAGAAAVAPVAVLATTAQTATTTTAATTPAKAAGPEGIATAKAQAQASSTGNSATQPQAAPDGISAAKAQAALEQLLPDGKLPFQFGDPAAQPTTKPALSEFMNQLQAEIQTPSFKGVGSASGEAAPLAAPGNQAGPDLQALMPAVQAAALSMGQPAKEASPSNPSLTGNFTPSEAVGAAAVPGASGAVRVTASTAPESTAPTRRENPMSQVDSSIRWLIKNKEQSAELQLHPEALGRVQVKITVEGTEVHAKLWASEASAMPILQEHRAFLESSLKAQGLTLGSFDLQHGQQQQDQSPLPRPEPFSPPLPFNPAPVNAEPDTPSAVKLAATGSNRIEIVA